MPRKWGTMSLKKTWPRYLRLYTSVLDLIWKVKTEQLTAREMIWIVGLVFNLPLKYQVIDMRMGWVNVYYLVSLGQRERKERCDRMKFFDSFWAFSLLLCYSLTYIECVKPLLHPFNEQTSTSCSHDDVYKSLCFDNMNGIECSLSVLCLIL